MGLALEVIKNNIEGQEFMVIENTQSNQYKLFIFMFLIWLKIS